MTAKLNSTASQNIGLNRGEQFSEEDLTKLSQELHKLTNMFKLRTKEIKELEEKQADLD